MSLAILFHFLCAQHVSGINISIIRSLRLCCWITTLVVMFLVRCVLEFRCGWVGVVSVLQASQPYRNSTTHRTKNITTNVVIQQHSRKLLMMDILMPETCWAHKKWNKIASDVKLVFYSSTIKMTHVQINIKFSINIFDILTAAWLNISLRTIYWTRRFMHRKDMNPNSLSFSVTWLAWHNFVCQNKRTYTHVFTQILHNTSDMCRDMQQL